ncbi:MAG: FecR domain-containing protein [Rhizobiales bacterium]|nr:FecR domain-containing protein [Hyphomicrobiales bacterium]
MSINKQKKIREEALNWSLLLEEEQSDDKIYNAFLEWLSANEANVLAWGEIEKTRAIALDSHITPMNKVDNITELQTGSPADLTSITPLGNTNTKKVSGASLKWAVALAATILMLIYIDPVLKFRVLTADFSTTAGERRQITLADGSVMHLASASAANFDETDEKRVVKLIKGTAFFHATKDKKRPFIVHHNRVQVRVTGTKFEVRSKRSGTDVAVREGEVLVANDRQKTLKPGEGTAVQAGERIRSNSNEKDISKTIKIEPQNIASWRQGKLIVDNWRAEDVLDALRNNFEGTLLISTWKYSEPRITGVFDLNTPKAALKIFAETQGWQFRELGNGIVILSQV